jgi:hypothetical protein
MVLIRLRIRSTNLVYFKYKFCCLFNFSLVVSGSNIHTPSAQFCTGFWTQRVARSQALFSLYSAISTNFGGI